MAIENRNLTAETRLVAKYKGQTYVCTVQEGEEGKIEYVLEDGKSFKSPSAAGSAVMGGSACNGWRFWAVEGDAPERASPGAEGDSTRKKARGKKFIYRVPNQTGVADGHAKFFCPACMKSFVARSGTAPEACPQGTGRRTRITAAAAEGEPEVEETFYLEDKSVLRPRGASFEADNRDESLHSA